jgi:hypothetical protein
MIGYSVEGMRETVLRALRDSPSRARMEDYSKSTRFFGFPVSHEAVIFDTNLLDCKANSSIRRWRSTKSLSKREERGDLAADKAGYTRASRGLDFGPLLLACQGCA